MKKPSWMFRNLFSASIKALSAGIFLGLSMPVFAESAPVYDVDSLPEQFESSNQTQSDVPINEQNQAFAEQAPNEEIPLDQSDGTFVPMQPQQQAQAEIEPAPEQVVQVKTPVKPPTTTSVSSSNNISSSNSKPATLSPPSSPPIRLSMEQRVKRVEQQVTNIQSSDNALHMEALQNQVQTLRGQLDQLTRQFQQLQTQQKAQYADMDKRLTAQVAAATPAPVPQGKQVALADTTSSLQKASEEANKTARKTAAIKQTTPNASSSNKQPNVAEEQKIYQTAYTLIKAKKYNEAVNTLQSMLRKYPTGQFASNAHYWLGELFGVMGKNDQALSEFNTVVKTYPDSPRVADAQLKLGLIFAAQLKWSDAKSAFKKVINQYPGSTSARLASDQLKQIRQAGH